MKIVVRYVEGICMLDSRFVEAFAADWIDAWNSHDLERILAHYRDDFEMCSPAIANVAGEASGTLKGKQRVADYWARALELQPNLHFELITAMAGVHSIVLYYKGPRGNAAEVFHFDAGGKVTQAYNHYEHYSG